MKNLEDFYIIGEPVETPIGLCEFIKVKDYPDVANDLGIMVLTKAHILNLLCEKQPKHKQNQIREELENVTLRELVFSIDELRDAYLNILQLVFSEESLNGFKPEHFDEVRNTILRMNCQKEEIINPNPEIQAFIEKSKRVKARDAETLKFSDLITSIVGFNGLSYKDINEFTIFQMQMTYQRIAQIKGYDTTTLFATVQGSKVKIVNWNKHINIFEADKHFMEQSEFNTNTASAFKD